jgi:uncharacterized circularly permuted ATP-grasp superfamily protein
MRSSLARSGNTSARQPVRLRVLLPVEEVPGGSIRIEYDRTRVRECGAGTQPDRPGDRGRRAVVAVVGDVVQRDVDRHRQAAAEQAILEMGITFTVYSEGQNIDRAWPLDIIPRVIDGAEWDRIERGLEQRLTALNLFIDDVYHDQRAIRDGIVPAELIRSSKDYLEVCRGVNPPHGVWAHVCGTDLVRDRDGTVYVLEDNLRVPSGVSYMLENRSVIKRVFPEVFTRTRILPVDDYPHKLFDMLTSLSPRQQDEPEIVVLTPGIFNSAYFEHAYLAQRRWAPSWSRARPGGGRRRLRLHEDHRRAGAGSTPIYRRVNDAFLDPERSARIPCSACAG